MAGRVDLVKDDRTAVRGIKRLVSIVSEICLRRGSKRSREGVKERPTKQETPQVYVLARTRQTKVLEAGGAKAIWRCTK